MGLSKKPYKGTRDFFPKDKRIHDYLFSKMHNTAHLFGYEPYDGPLLEEVELYKAKSGEELINEQIYSFTDRGERFVAIRPEMTPTLARMVAQVHKECARPLRWYSIPNLMRYEKPQKGRLREHWQFNCDIFGAPKNQGEIEILQLAISLFESYGARNQHFEILVNNRQIIDYIFNELMQLTSENSYKLYKIIDRAKKVSHDALQEMISALGLTEENNKLLNCYFSFTSFDDVQIFIKEKGNDPLSAELQEFAKLLKELNLLQYVKYDPTIVRGLDYYTGLVFEIYDKNPDNRRALCGGGSYANLLKIFDEDPLPGIGFGLGDVTLQDFLTTHKLLPDVAKQKCDLYLAYETSDAMVPSYLVLPHLRMNEISVITSLETSKYKKIFQNAERFGASVVAIVNVEDGKASTITMKRMNTKEPQTFSLDSLAEIVKFIKS